MALHRRAATRDAEIRRRFRAGRSFAQLYREFGRRVVDRAIRAWL